MDTVVVKTSELIGSALDWAVAKCEVRKIEFNYQYTEEIRFDGWWQLGPNHWQPLNSYSTHWAQGGPIIEREDITVRPVFHAERTESGSDICRGDGWSAHVEPKAFWVTPRPKTGTTPLIAAMRCYVASKLGDTVQIPKELLTPEEIT